ncbi:unnamed protein product [Schistosoma rodhaini]|uniref:Uncharacterized protein n=1 Tax=Schistosoma rodhaini TaxID=6188 RepID=A0A183RUP1_9TREM|nr:unnamed protein product [Schistosoma rodhaini]
MQTSKSRTITLLTFLIILILIISYWELAQARSSKSSSKTVVKHNTVHKTVQKHPNKPPTKVPQRNSKQPATKKYNSTYNPPQIKRPLNPIKRQIRGNMIREEFQSLDTYPNIYRPLERLNNYQQDNNNYQFFDKVPMNEQNGYISQLGD